MDEEVNRAAILEIDPATGTSRVFASGLRNPVGIDWNPASGELWAAVNERDEIGGDLPPDYMTNVRPGGFYGWRSEEHTSELQSLMRNSYAVFCLKKKTRRQ